RLPDTDLPPSATRRSFVARSIAALSLTPFMLPSQNYAKTMKTPNANDVVVAAAPTAGQAGRSIRPFSFRAPRGDLEDLRRRIVATRLPEKEPVLDAAQGVQLATVQKLARYWATEYDWRKVEARLNALPNFMTEIDGLDIHFIHARSKHENALPLIVTHGWPGSII